MEDAAAVAEAVCGSEVIIHLAWSFSDDPQVLLEQDLRGHLLLLDAAKSQGVRHFIYTSTAVVYGKPIRVPIDEDHPLRVLEARKPAYGMAKDFAEKLTLLASRAEGAPATILRFWWAFGEEIGGRHLREMLRTAAAGKPLPVPANCGGSFLSMEDFIQAVEVALVNPGSFGQVFNLASPYVTWEEVARMAVEVTGSSAGVEVIPGGMDRGGLPRGSVGAGRPKYPREAWFQTRSRPGRCSRCVAAGNCAHLATHRSPEHLTTARWPSFNMHLRLFTALRL